VSTFLSSRSSVCLCFVLGPLLFLFFVNDLPDWVINGNDDNIVGYHQHDAVERHTNYSVQRKKRS